MKEPAVLKGTKDGYEIVFDDQAGMEETLLALERLLENLRTQVTGGEAKTIAIDVLTGNRLWDASNRQRIETIFDKFPMFTAHKILATVIEKEAAARIIEQESVHVVDRIVRNGQELVYQGDVLFLGEVHQGGKLVVDGNIYVLGTINGIIHAGAPNFESKLIIGDLHNAQQIRIGEQHEIVDDTTNINFSNNTVSYVNDLHILDYGKLEDLKQINPKFFNQIGGIING